jgi:succinate dehydrogenase/fumarate reductase flavoprotein subunit
MEKVTTDVLVIGSGLAGLTAAYVISRENKDIAILSDGPGASPWIHSFCVPLDPNDSVKTYLNDTLSGGSYLSNPALASALCGDSIICFEWLEQMGIKFSRDGDKYRLFRPLGASYPRLVSCRRGAGVEIIEKITGELKGKACIFENSRALSLCTQEGNVSGALVYDKSAEAFFIIQAKAVILASGGFCGIYPFSTNKRDSGGDGIAMAFNAGADLLDLEFVQFEPSVAVWPPAVRGLGMITTMLYEGAILRNANNERFMLKYPENTECVGKDVMTVRIASEIYTGNGTGHGGIWFDATGLGKAKLKELYPSYYERYANVGIDLSREMIELAPAAHTSLGGIEIDVECSTSVPGLYACGEIAGGIHGANRMGGSAGLETLVFGRRAGFAVLEFLKNNYSERPCSEKWAKTIIGRTDCSSSDIEITQIRKNLRKIMDESLGVLREGRKLTDAKVLLDSLLERSENLAVKSDHEAFERLRLCNDLLTAKLLCLSALERTDSVGCHNRIDSVQSGDRPYNVVITGDKPMNGFDNREVLVRKRYI